ncbi:MAG: DUF1801 domain-containing protein [Longimicrobiales bacterium]|nr:DUF1801 domain-containing protein [Longimicrobiales bacterium]
MKSDAKTPKEYLDALPEDRRKVVAAVRKLVNAHIQRGFKEGMSYGMITWSVPRERCPDSYNGQPLGYVCLAAQKNYYTLHLFGVYMSEEALGTLRDRYSAAGKKLDMGKACVRFKKLEDLIPDVLGDAVASMSVDDVVSMYEAARRRR